MGIFKTIALGKCDYNGTGRKVYPAEITVEYVAGRLSICGDVWQPNRRDIVCGGQCHETLAELFPNDPHLARILPIWKRWHLNDMKAGSPAQEGWLREHPIDPKDYASPKSYFQVASERLAAAGLNPDADGYKYGSAWKHEEIPADVLAEIENW